MSITSLRVHAVTIVAGISTFAGVAIAIHEGLVALQSNEPILAAAVSLNASKSVSGGSCYVDGKDDCPGVGTSEHCNADLCSQHVIQPPDNYVMICNKMEGKSQLLWHYTKASSVDEPGALGVDQLDPVDCNELCHCYLLCVYSEIAERWDCFTDFNDCDGIDSRTETLPSNVPCPPGDGWVDNSRIELNKILLANGLPCDD